MKSLAMGILLLFIFVAAFFVTTAFVDMLDRHMGYYDQGIQEAQEVGQ